MSSHTLVLDGKSLDPAHLWEAARCAGDPASSVKVSLTKEAWKKIERAESWVKKVLAGTKAVYGINTGFGKFAEVRIPPGKLEELQENLIVSHACGMGPNLARELVMGQWLIRLNTLSRGNSGIRRSTVEQILVALEKGLLADVPARGSVGASGDLAPSAHAVLALLGQGNASLPERGGFKNLPAEEALKKIKMKPLKLGPKEGLSLINGTQTTTVLALKGWYEGEKLLEAANLAAAFSIEALRGSHSVVDGDVLRSRNQPGALRCGNAMKHWLDGESGIAKSHTDCTRVQDPYSLRCAPQVHGAVAEDLDFAKMIIRREINASTDNPLIFPEEDKVVSGGNFHALYTAKVCDHLASALTNLATISERRIALAMSPESSQLPAFLAHDGGLNSGFMMAQVTAAALASECKSLSFPASVDSIPTSGDREDHVSMGPIAGLKLLQIVENVRRVIAIELLVMSQAIDLLRPLKTTKRLQTVHQKIRKHVAPLKRDRVLSTDMERVTALLYSGELLEA